MDSASHDILVTAVTAVSGGTLLLILARRIHVPAIVVLLVGGAVFGPQGVGLIKPASFGDGLLVLVELSVGLILFEGGLTLRPEGYRSAPAMIKRLLTLGVLITWLTTALVIRLVVGLSWQQAVIAASLIIVTGPTVIAPLLKRIRVNERLHSILNWEAVLIDPIGVFVAVLCFEWIGEQTGPSALLNLGVRTGVGLGVGLAGGAVMLVAAKRRLVPPDLMNIFTLAGAILIFGLAEAFISKAGLLAVTVAGFAFGLAARAEIKEVRRFKAELTDLLIATLFMLLAARLEWSQFDDFGLRGALAVAAVLILIRPLCIVLCSVGLDLSVRERAFLAWIAPRGIVAASMASLFAISLEQRGMANARFVETFTYSVIIATILVQGLTAGPLVRLLDIGRSDPKGWLIVGATGFARRLARFIRRSSGATAVLVDTSASKVRESLDEGLTALRADARDVELADRHQLVDIGHVLALTDNEDLNARICTHWSDIVGPDHVYRWRPGLHADSRAEQSSLGRPIWPALPRPSAVSSEIDRDATQIIETAGTAPPPSGASLLATDDGARVHLIDAASRPPDERSRCLYIRRESDALQRSVRAESVLLVPEPTSFETLLPAMLQRLCAACPRLAADDFLETLLERERALPSVLGEGVAAPHGYSEHATDQLCAIACTREPIAYPDRGGEPVRLVFLLISPAGDPKAHLTLLAEIARRVEHEAVRDAMLGASTPEEVIATLARLDLPRGPA